MRFVRLRVGQGMDKSGTLLWSRVSDFFFVSMEKPYHSEEVLPSASDDGSNCVIFPEHFVPPQISLGLFPVLMMYGEDIVVSWLCVFHPPFHQLRVEYFPQISYLLRCMVNIKLNQTQPTTVEDLNGNQNRGSKVKREQTVLGKNVRNQKSLYQGEKLKTNFPHLSGQTSARSFRVGKCYTAKYNDTIVNRLSTIVVKL